jgi:hypothetical protein
MILCSTPGKREVKMSLNETDSWVWKGSEMTCGMYGKMDSETFDETNNKRNEKTTSNLLYPRKTTDRNTSSASISYLRTLTHLASHVHLKCDILQPQPDSVCKSNQPLHQPFYLSRSSTSLGPLLAFPLMSWMTVGKCFKTMCGRCLLHL